MSMRTHLYILIFEHRVSGLIKEVQGLRFGVSEYRFD